MQERESKLQQQESPFLRNMGSGRSYRSHRGLMKADLVARKVPGIVTVAQPLSVWTQYSKVFKNPKTHAMCVTSFSHLLSVRTILRVIGLVRSGPDLSM